MRRKVVSGLIMMIVIGWVVILSSPLNRYGIARSKGYITTGRFIDVIVGEQSDSARKKMLSHGLRMINRKSGRNCMGVIYDENLSVELFFDDSWRWGTVCVASFRGRVQSINWHYDFMSP